MLPDAEPPALDCVVGVEAEALPLAWLALELLPLEVDGALPPVPEGALLVLDGALAVPEGALPPDAFVDPEALPEPDDWLVCAPWFMVDDGLVVVALWFAEVLLDTFWWPLPMFTPGLMLALALTSVLLMPTLASTPTFGLTFTPPEGAVVELVVEGELPPPAAEGELPPVAPLEPEVLPEPDDWLCWVLWFIFDDGLVVVAL